MLLLERENEDAPSLVKVVDASAKSSARLNLAPWQSGRARSERRAAAASSHLATARDLLQLETLSPLCTHYRGVLLESH